VEARQGARVAHAEGSRHGKQEPIKGETGEARGTFKGVKDEMCGLEWGELYERFHANAYNSDELWRRVEELLGKTHNRAKGNR